MSRLSDSAVNKDWYEETQKIPGRIKGAENGKAAVRAFVRAWETREKAEHPEEYEKYKDNAWYRFMMLNMYFSKYLMNEEVDKDTNRNSFIITLVDAPNGQHYFTHNMLDYAVDKWLPKRIKWWYKYFKKAARK